MRKRSQTSLGRRQINGPRMPGPPVVVSEPLPPVIEVPPMMESEVAEYPTVAEFDPGATELSAGQRTEFDTEHGDANAGSRMDVLLDANRAAIYDSLDDETDVDDDDLRLIDIPEHGLVDEVTPQSAQPSQAVSAAYLLADRNQLKSVIVAMEVLGAPKSLRM